MKKWMFVFLLIFLMSAILSSCGSGGEMATNSDPSETSQTTAKNGVTQEMAYEGVSSYCHSMYDWSVAEDNPDMMYLEMGEETESTYQVIFRSYTGAFVYFYVDKASGSTRLVEYVPALEIEEEIGTIDLYDYLTDDREK